MARTRHGSTMILAVAIAAMAGTALGQEPPKVDAPAPPTPAPAVRQAAPGELDALVKDLGAPEVVARISASSRIFDGPFRLKDIEGVLRRDDLSLEQRVRLINIAHRRFETEPRGAMGIEFNMDAPDVRGALIKNAKREFHAGEVLQPRDRIVQADGSQIDRRDSLRRIIVSHDPGDEVPLVVERDGATISVTVRLGEFRALNQPKDPVVHRQAWERRSRGYAGPGAADERPIECGVQGAAWTPGPELEDDAELMGLLPSQRARVLPGGDDRTGVVAGGEPRLGLARADVPSRAGMAIDPVLRGPRAAPGAANAELMRALARRSALIDQMTQNNVRMSDPALPEPVRAQLKLINERLSQDVQRLDEDLRRLMPARPNDR